MSPSLNLCGVQATVTVEQRMQKNMLLLRFLFCSSIRNWFLLILFKTRDYNNFGTNKCEQNIYFVN
jgi:hypothetical protein